MQSPPIRHRHRWPTLTATLLAGLLAVDLALFALLPVRALHPDLPSPDQEPVAVAAILFNGFNVERTEINDETKRRLAHGLALLRGGRAKLLLVAGGNRPGQTANGARLMAGYLQSQGLAENRIVVEDQSRDSRSNLDRIREKLRTQGLGSTALVSSPHHLWRIRLLPGQVAAGFTFLPYDPTDCVPPLTRLEIWCSAHNNGAAWLAAVLLPERLYDGIVGWVRTYTTL